MPQIPVYGQPTVTPQPLPNVRLNPNAPEGAFGIPKESPLGGMQQVAAAIYEDERKKANTTAVLGAAADLTKQHTELLYGPPGHPELGALNQHGENALAVPDQVQQAWQKTVSDISAKQLHNDDQREAFARMVNDYGASLFEAVQRHVSTEMDQLHDQNTRDFLTNERASAVSNWQDPAFIERSIARQTAVLKVQGQRKGWTPDELKQAIGDAKSQTYLRTLEVMAANHSPMTKDYYTAHQKDFQADDAARAAGLEKESSTRQQGFAEADRIVGIATDRQNAMELAKGITDPDVRMFVQGQLQEHYNVVKQNEAEQMNQRYLAAKQIVDANPGVKDIRSIIPPGMWNDLTPEHIESLRRYAKGDIPNDDQRWLQFIDRGTLPIQQLGQMDQATYYTQYRSHFDLQHQAEADAQWEAARNAVANGKYDDPKLTEMYSDSQRVWLTLKNNRALADPNKPYGKLNDSDATLVNQTLDQFNRAVNSYELSTLGGKRKATNDEKQQILDNMITQKVFIDRSFLPDREKLSVVVQPDERSQAYVPYTSIPPQSAALMRNLMQSYTQKVDQRTIERLYAAQLLDGRELMTQLRDLNSNINKILLGKPVDVKPTPLIQPKPIVPSQRRPGSPLGSAFHTMGDYIVGGAINRALQPDTTKKTP